MKRLGSSAGAIPARKLVAPSGSYRSGGGGNETVEAFETTGRLGQLGKQAGRNGSERRASPETTPCGSRPGCYTGKAAVRGDTRGLPLTTRHAPGVPPGYGRWHACTRRSDATREASAVGARDPQPTTREGQVGPFEVAERPVGARRPGNAGGAKGPEFKANVERSKSQEIGHGPSNSGYG